MPREYETVRHPYMDDLNCFLVRLNYRTPHLHNEIELALVLSGSGRILFQDRDYEIKPGDCYLIDRHVTHEIRSSHPEGVMLLVLQLSPRFFKEIGHFNDNITFNTFYPIPYLKDPEDFQRVFLKIAESYLTHTPYAQLLCMSFLCQLFYHLLTELPVRQLSLEERLTIDRNAERLSRLLDYIDENYTHKIRLQDFAEQEGLSLGYLSHFVKNTFHQTFQDYVNRLRLNHACKLIAEGASNLLEISLESGFSDVRYMNKAFLRYTGLTAREYIKTNSKLSEPGLVVHNEHTKQQLYGPEESLLIIREMIDRQKAL